MLTIKLMRKNEDYTLLSCANYGVHHNKGNTVLSVYPTLTKENGVDYGLHEDTSDGFYVAYVTNEVGKTIDRINYS